MAAPDAHPSDDIEILTFHFAPSGGIPNNPGLPALVMKSALRAPGDPQAVRAMMEANGWSGSWTYTVFDYDHWHPASHEALVAVSGWADIRLGGPGGELLRAEPGDAMILPAGTGHCREAASGDFAVCGAYPPGQESPEILRADAVPIEAAHDRIRAAALPLTDPICGETGPLIEAWGVSR